MFSICGICSVNHIHGILSILYILSILNITYSCLQNLSPFPYPISHTYIQMTASGHKVKQVAKVKILGYTMQSNLHNDKQIAKIISNINNRLHNINKLATHTTIKSCTILTKAIVIGKLNYGLPLLCNSTKAQLNKLNTLVIKSCRVIMGNSCLKWSSSRLLKKCKMQSIYYMIT